MRISDWSSDVCSSDLLMPAPFSQGWIGNIRTLAAAHWWDGTSVYRVQDNYVAQWGDADGEDKANAKPLPEGLAAVQECEYVVHLNIEPLTDKAVWPEIGRAHVCTPVTNAHLVCRHVSEKK